MKRLFAATLALVLAFAVTDARAQFTDVKPKSTVVDGNPALLLDYGDQLGFLIVLGKLHDQPAFRFSVSHLVAGFWAIHECGGQLWVSATEVAYQPESANEDCAKAAFEVPKAQLLRGFSYRNAGISLPIKSGPKKHFGLGLALRPDLQDYKWWGRLPEQRRDAEEAAMNDLASQWVNGAFLDFAAASQKFVAAASGEPLPNPAPPKPTTATLQVTSDPGNAQVYVDGIFKGQTDDAGQLIVESTPGDHDLRLDHADYKEWKGKVTLTGERSEQKIAMVKRGPDPLPADEIDQALSSGMTPARCADLVKQYGVNFIVTPEIDKRLRDKGADSDLLLTIAENKR